MTRQEAEQIVKALVTAVNELVVKPAPSVPIAQGIDGSTLVKKPTIIPASPERTRAETDEKLFEQFKKWLLDDLREDPVFVQLLAQRPELVVEFTPRRVTLQGDSLRGRLARLMAQGWFATPRAVGTCRAELKRTGADPGGGGNLSQALIDFKKDGFLTTEGDAYVLAPDVKVTEKELVSE